MMFCGAALAALVWPEAEGGVVSRADFASAQVRNNSPTGENKTANSETIPPAPRIAAKRPMAVEIPATAEGGAIPPDVRAPLRMDGGEVALWDFNERSFSAADKMSEVDAATPSIVGAEKTAVAAVDFNPAGDSFTGSWAEGDQVNPNATAASANPILVANVLRGWAHPGIIPSDNPNYDMVMALRNGDFAKVERFLARTRIAVELQERVEGGKFAPHEAMFRGYVPALTNEQVHAHRYSSRLKQTTLFKYYDRFKNEDIAGFAKALMCYGFDPMLPDSEDKQDSIQLALENYYYFGGKNLLKILDAFVHGVDCDYNLNFQYHRRGVKATHQITTYQGRPFDTFYDSEKYMEWASELPERYVDRHDEFTMLRAAVLKILDKAVEREPCSCSCTCLPPDTGESCTCSCSCSN